LKQNKSLTNNTAPRDNTIILERYADQFKTLKHIDRIAELNKSNPIYTRWIDMFNLDKIQDPEHIIFLLAFYLAKFQPDNPNIQAIREPWRVAKDGLANCVDYTTFISGFLRHPKLRIPHVIKMVSFDNSNNYSHIYTQTNDTTLDPVVGQDQQGQERLKANLSRVPYYNVETPYKNKYTFNVK